MKSSKDLYIELGKKIKSLRIENNLTQEELAKSLHLQRTSVTNIEAGKQAAPLHIYYQVCVLFKENLGDLLSENLSPVISIDFEKVTTEDQVGSHRPKLFQVMKKISSKLESSQPENI